MQEVSKRENFFRRKRVLFLFIVVIAVISELIYSNSHIDIEHITISDSSIPDGFDGCVIVQVSDYHNIGGNTSKRLIEEISAQNPDYIFITGDVCDGIRTDIQKVNEFFEQASQIAPCYLVWGNHDMGVDAEIRSSMYQYAKENDITVLQNQYKFLKRNGDKILLTGTINYINNDKVKKMLGDYPEYDGFSIWLHHYPEDFQLITSAVPDTDLIFSGHAHGGLINGLYAPGQGFFPEYTSGLYEKYNSKMIVSRGVGNSGYTLRMFDPFHLVVCTLEKP